MPGTTNKYGLNSLELQSKGGGGERGREREPERTRVFAEMGATARRGSSPGRLADGKQLLGGVCVTVTHPSPAGWGMLQTG